MTEREEAQAAEKPILDWRKSLCGWGAKDLDGTEIRIEHILIGDAVWKWAFAWNAGFGIHIGTSVFETAEEAKLFIEEKISLHSVDPEEFAALAKAARDGGE